MPTLQYYFIVKGIIDHVIFNKYTIENGIIRNKKGEAIKYHKNEKKYNKCMVTDDYGKRRSIQVGRAIASSILGPPATLEHTADHIDKNPENDVDDNIRWSTKKEQMENQNRPDTYKTAYIVVKDGKEQTIREWVDFLKDEKNPYWREYNYINIKSYAQKKQHGFSYKEYPDLPGEVWKEITGAKNWKGYWLISDMNRVKYVTKQAENVLSGDRLGLEKGYPIIWFNGKQWPCHIIAFMTFFPKEYAAKKPGECVLHEDDDKLDFRPHKLRIGTQTENMIDAQNNGKYDGKKSARMKCASYIDNVLEKEHKSQNDAMRYLRSRGYETASAGNICSVLNGNGNRKTAYGRTWKLVE